MDPLHRWPRVSVAEVRRHPVWQQLKAFPRKNGERLPKTKYDIMQALENADLLKAFDGYPLDNTACGYKKRPLKKDLLAALRESYRVPVDAWKKATFEQMCMKYRSLDQPEEFAVGGDSVETVSVSPRRPRPPARARERSSAAPAAPKEPEQKEKDKTPELDLPPELRMGGSARVSKRRSWPLPKKSRRSSPQVSSAPLITRSSRQSRVSLSPQFRPPDADSGENPDSLPLPSRRHKRPKRYSPTELKRERKRKDKSRQNVRGYTSQAVRRDGRHQKIVTFTEAYARELYRVTGQNMQKITLPFEMQVLTLAELRKQPSLSTQQSFECSLTYTDWARMKKFISEPRNDQKSGSVMDGARSSKNKTFLQGVPEIEYAQRFPLNPNQYCVLATRALRRLVLEPNNFSPRLRRWRVAGVLGVGTTGMVLSMKDPDQGHLLAVKFMKNCLVESMDENRGHIPAVEFALVRAFDAMNLGAGVGHFEKARRYSSISSKPLEFTLRRLLDFCVHLNNPERDSMLHKIGRMLYTLVKRLKAWGVTHGDFHLENVMFRLHGPKGEYYPNLIDFGRTFSFCFVSNMDLSLMVRSLYLHYGHHHPGLVQSLISQFPKKVRYKSFREVDRVVSKYLFEDWRSVLVPRLKHAEGSSRRAPANKPIRQVRREDIMPDIVVPLSVGGSSNPRPLSLRQPWLAKERSGVVEEVLHNVFPGFEYLETLTVTGDGVVCWVSSPAGKRHLAKCSRQHLSTRPVTRVQIQQHFSTLNLAAPVVCKTPDPDEGFEFESVILTRDPVAYTLYDVAFGGLCSDPAVVQSKMLAMLECLRKSVVGHGSLEHWSSSWVLQESASKPGAFALKLFDLSWASWETSYPADYSVTRWLLRLYTDGNVNARTYTAQNIKDITNFSSTYLEMVAYMDAIMDTEQHTTLLTQRRPPFPVTVLPGAADIVNKSKRSPKEPVQVVYDSSDRVLVRTTVNDAYKKVMASMYRLEPQWLSGVSFAPQAARYLGLREAKVKAALFRDQKKKEITLNSDDFGDAVQVLWKWISRSSTVDQSQVFSESRNFSFPFSPSELSRMLGTWVVLYTGIWQENRPHAYVVSLLPNENVEHGERLRLLYTDSHSEKPYFELDIGISESPNACFSDAVRAGLTRKFKPEFTHGANFFVRRSFSFHLSLVQAWAAFPNESYTVRLAQAVSRLLDRLKHSGLRHGNLVPENIVLVRDKTRPEKYHLLLIDYSAWSRARNKSDADRDAWNEHLADNPFVPERFQQAFSILAPRELSPSSSVRRPVTVVLN